MHQCWKGKSGMSEQLIKSKARVKAHGEVFTPSWMVDKMLNLVQAETDDIYKTFLEPSAGDGNFLVAILDRKLESIKIQFDKKYWATKSLFALASIYGIEIQKDNLHEARGAMLSVFCKFHDGLKSTEALYKAARYIIHENIAWGDTLKKLTPDGAEIVFNEWRPVANSSTKVERIPFTFSSMFADEEVAYQIPLGYEQLSLFADEEPEVKDENSVKYKIVDIKNVWKEELDHGE